MNYQKSLEINERKKKIEFRMISYEISKSLNCVNPSQPPACCFRFISTTLEYLKSRRIVINLTLIFVTCSSQRSLRPLCNSNLLRIGKYFLCRFLCAGEKERPEFRLPETRLFIAFFKSLSKPVSQICAAVLCSL